MIEYHDGVVEACKQLGIDPTHVNALTIRLKLEHIPVVNIESCVSASEALGAIGGVSQYIACGDQMPRRPDGTLYPISRPIAASFATEK